jgi:hypothetical protein
MKRLPSVIIVTSIARELLDKNASQAYNAE